MLTLSVPKYHMNIMKISGHESYLWPFSKFDLGCPLFDLIIRAKIQNLQPKLTYCRVLNLDQLFNAILSPACKSCRRSSRKCVKTCKAVKIGNDIRNLDFDLVTLRSLGYITLPIPTCDMNLIKIRTH